MEERLRQLIVQVKSNVGLRGYDEQTTKQVLILRILDVLGWNIFDLLDIQPEYLVDPKNNNEKVDYALLKDSRQMLFIEAKAVGIDLEDHEEQICRYCFRNDVNIGILTNGVDWWFYLPRAQGSWYERKFYSINLIEQDINEVVPKFISFLSKQNVIDGKSYESAKEIHERGRSAGMIKDSLPKAWNSLILSEDEKILELLNDKLEKISGYRAEPEVLAEFLHGNVNRLSVGNEGALPTKYKTEDGADHLKTPKNISYTRTGYTGKRIISFELVGKKYDVRSWQELLLITCKTISALQGKDFEKVLVLRARRPYFTKNETELRIPKKIPGSDIFVETHLNANSIVDRCYDMLGLFGYKREDLNIRTN